MQIIDSAAIEGFLFFALAVLALGLGAAVAVVALGLRVTRRERQARHESIPAYYGRLHFAH